MHENREYYEIMNIMNTQLLECLRQVFGPSEGHVLKKEYISINY